MSFYIMIVSSPISKDCTHNTCKLVFHWIKWKNVSEAGAESDFSCLRTFPSSSQAEHRSRSYMCPCDTLAHEFFSLASKTKEKLNVKDPTASIQEKSEWASFFLLSQQQWAPSFSKFLVDIFQRCGLTFLSFFVPVDPACFAPCGRSNFID